MHLFLLSHKFNELESFILRPAILIPEGYFKQCNYYTRTETWISRIFKNAFGIVGRRLEENSWAGDS